jgi:hypothetical protein
VHGPGALNPGFHGGFGDTRKGDKHKRDTRKRWDDFDRFEDFLETWFGFGPFDWYEDMLERHSHHIPIDRPVPPIPGPKPGWDPRFAAESAARRSTRGFADPRSPLSHGYGSVRADPYNANPYVVPDGGRLYSSGASPAYGSYGSPNSYGASPGAGPQPDAQPAANLEGRNVLSALGVASTDGRLSWPLGVRILPGDGKAEALRNQIDTLLTTAAKQSARGQIRPALLQELGSAVNELHGLLRKKKDDFASATTYEEAHQFLTKLAKRVKQLQ